MYDLAFLGMAWNQVRGNRGNTNGRSRWLRPRSISPGTGGPAQWAARRPHGQRGSSRPGAREGNSEVVGQSPLSAHTDRADRIVQASLKLVLESIFAGTSNRAVFGFRPGRGRGMRSPRSISSRPAAISGGSRPTSRRAFDEISPSGRRGPDERSDRRQACACADEGVPQGGHPQPRGPGPTDHHRYTQGGILSRCWPTSPCPLWTSISQLAGKGSARSGCERSIVTSAAPWRDSSDTRTTS